MNKLCNAVFVLRQIALKCSNAHLAFLYHAPYRKQYNTEGGVYELTLMYGTWLDISDEIGWQFTNYLVFCRIEKNGTCVGMRHPLLPNFLETAMNYTTCEAPKSTLFVGYSAWPLDTTKIYTDRYTTKGVQHVIKEGPQFLYIFDYIQLHNRPPPFDDSNFQIVKECWKVLRLNKKV